MNGQIIKIFIVMNFWSWYEADLDSFYQEDTCKNVPYFEP